MFLKKKMGLARHSQSHLVTLWQTSIQLLPFPHKQIHILYQNCPYISFEEKRTKNCIHSTSILPHVWQMKIFTENHTPTQHLSIFSKFYHHEKIIWTNKRKCISNKHFSGPNSEELWVMIRAHEKKKASHSLMKFYLGFKSLNRNSVKRKQKGKASNEYLHIWIFVYL